MWDADDFPRDPYGWLTNQTGHALIGQGLALPLLFYPAPLWLIVPVVAGAYFLVWEVAIQRGKLWLDSAMDAACVGAGAALAAGLWINSGWTIAGAALAWGAVLAQEVARRS